MEAGSRSAAFDPLAPRTARMLRADEDGVLRFRCERGVDDDVAAEEPALANAVLRDFARNCKRGPFTSTAGLVIPYYMNLATNLLDRHVSRKVVQLLEGALNKWFSEPYRGQRVLCVGPEVAGGIMVAQLAAASTSLHWLDFVYFRKQRKSTGTRQQLEGSECYTGRTPVSDPIPAIWVDDCISTGSSLVVGERLLREAYNIHVVGAAFLVDRSMDRQNLAHVFLTADVLARIDVRSIYDISELEAFLNFHPPG